ncbi:MAG: transglycosylase [Deltaproteobacteria bacterium]|nr:transglycosylase [Deltaproteobacteria bacterium]
MSRLTGRCFCLFALLLFLSGFTGLPASGAQPGCGAEIKRLSSSDYPVFSDDLDYKRLDTALAGSIGYLKNLPQGKKIKVGPDWYLPSVLAAGFERFSDFITTRPESRAVAGYVAAHGRVYTAFLRSKQADVLFTGYFEPELAGSRTRTSRFCLPVYSRPDDLVILDQSRNSRGLNKKKIIGRYSGKLFAPYYDRQQITSENAIYDHARVIAWVADPVALFFLHVQGSGRVRFADGASINVHYDISNGLPYKSIGAYLIRKGKIPKAKMSMQAIYEYLAAHPKEIDETLNYNPRYIFFRTAPAGVTGSIGVPLTPGRSVALDSHAAPAGVLLFISAKKPVCDASFNVVSWTPFSRFTLNQDTGSAIKGLCRADIFWGSGDYARVAAGHMKERGRLYYIVFDR